MTSFRYAASFFAVACNVAGAQQVVTRSQAIDAALSRGARLGIARADTAIAHAQLLTARARQNPALPASYSKSVPQIHLTLELPLDFPSVRGLRIESAQATRRAAGYRFQVERAAIALDADTTFTRAHAAIAHAALSRRNAAYADTLLRMAIARRDAGDAAELDVQLATVNAGQQSNIAIADSFQVVLTLEDLRTVMGLPAGTGLPVIADSLTPPPADSAMANMGTPLPVAAAEQALTAADLAIRLERRNVFGSPLMTTLCTLFGLLPLALGLGAGSELQRPLALAVIGGLALSTPITLYVVPTLLVSIRGRRYTLPLETRHAHS